MTLVEKALDVIKFEMENGEFNTFVSVDEEELKQAMGLEIDDEWVQTRMEMNPAREWYLVGTPYCGDLEYIRARIPE